MNQVSLISQLKELIEKYCEFEEGVVSEFQRIYNSKNPLSLYRNKKIPQEGSIGIYKYEFHGMGVFIENGDFSADIECGDKGRTGVFDAWRIRSFAENFEEYLIFQEENNINKLLPTLEDVGFIVKVSSSSSSKLYQLKK